MATKPPSGSPTAPLQHLALFFLLAFAAMAAAAGYWTLVEREALINRLDNPRALIAFGRIQRGQILDRNNAVLAETTGQPGNFVRRYPEAAAALVVGYSSFRYGASGIEAAADAILSGTEGLSLLERWWRHGLLGEPQIGRAVRLTLDAGLQRAAFEALGGRAGAVVAVGPASGDILVLASSPSFDPSQLEQDFETFTADDNGPLINRAANALYPPGAAANLFPHPIDFSSAPELPIPTHADTTGRASPLQMALLAAAVANDGTIAAPRLIAAVQPAVSPEWVEQKPTGHNIAVLPPSTAGQIRAALNQYAAGFGLAMPGFIATVPSGFGSRTVGWFIGLQPESSLAICVLLEDGTGAQAGEIASAIFKK